MAKSNSFETDFLELIFNNTTISNIGNAGGIDGAGATGNFYVRLYTTAVTVDDSTIGTECAYTGYVAGGVAVARTSGGWTVSGNQVSNTSAITFGACTAGSETVGYFAIWKDNVGSTDADRLFWGALDSNLAVSSGITPEFGASQLVITED